MKELQNKPEGASRRLDSTVFGRDRTAMNAAILDGLPPLYRLALAYSPAVSRLQWLTLLSFDSRLGSIIRQARDPVLAQIRLAWWRERLAQPTAQRPKGEPLLACLADWPESGAGLAALVDGWEALLGEGPIDEAAILQFASGRGSALIILAEQIGVQAAGASDWALRWSLADLACHFGQAQEREAAVSLHAASAKPLPIDRRLRPLVVLERVTTRAMLKGGAAALATPGALFTAMRAGLLGR